MSNEIYHHGIQGQKWGVRRYQNEDGTLTSAGRRRYGEDNIQNNKSTRNSSNKKSNHALRNAVIREAAVVAGSNAVASMVADKTGNLPLTAISSFTLSAGGTLVNYYLTSKAVSKNKR